MLNKFIFGNKQIPEMYFGNIPVSQIYFGNTLIWEKEGYVPYDSTCSIIITGDDTTQKFTVQVMKDGKDVTSSLDHFKGWAYIVNDVLPVYRLFLHNIPYSTVIANGKEFSITELINACKSEEHITDSRYDDTKGEYHIDASEITSKAGGSFPSSGAIACQNNVVVPYTLTEDTSTNDIWMIVSQNTSNTPIEIKTIKVASTFTGYGVTSIYIFHESGLLVYKYDSTWYAPSVTTQEHGGVTYNYVTIDLSALSTGTFSLKRGDKYYIKIKHASNNDNHYYYRNGGILGIVGFVTGNINLPNLTYDISSLTYEGVKNTEAAMLTVSTANHYAKYTGPSNCFSSNQVYKCKLGFTYTGTTDDDCDLLAIADGAMGTYNGQSGAMSLGNKTYVKSGAPVSITKTNDYSTILSCSDSTKIFKYTGNSVGDIFEQNKFYSCKNVITITAAISTAPAVGSVALDDVYLVLSSFNYGHYNSHYAYPGIWRVTTVTADDYEMTHLNTSDYIVNETNNMKAKLSELTDNNISTYYDLLSSTDLSGLTVSTTHKHEILMGA